MILKECNKCIVRAACNKPCELLRNKITKIRKIFNKIERTVTWIQIIFILFMIVHWMVDIESYQAYMYIAIAVGLGLIKPLIIVVWAIEDHKYSKKFKPYRLLLRIP